MASTKPTQLPKRVLLIEEKNQVRLLEPRAGQAGCYVCLSHCWGGHVALQTTTSTIHELESGIEWSKIPLTFQHAIDMTYQLGIKYLWIDSLCIVQDDPEDWRHESGQMASIYSKAFVTLAATNAKDSRQGFYTTPPRTRDYREITLSHTENAFSVCVRPEISTKRFCQGDLPLLLRAWFLQERLLSSRVIHFADTFVYWECSATRECEKNTRVDPSFKKDCFMTQRVDQQNPFQPVPKSEGSFVLQRKWHKIIAEYSRLDLSKRQDVMPALQGVAAYIQEERKCDYYAGLWKDNILYDLLWRSASPSRRSANYYAPSWSWASHMGRVSWDEQNVSFHPEAQVLSISTTPAGQNPLGQLVSGMLQLKGKCMSGVLMRRKTRNEVQWSTADGKTVSGPFHEDYEDESFDVQEVETVVIGTQWSYVSVSTKSYVLVLRAYDMIGADSESSCAAELKFYRIGIACFWHVHTETHKSEGIVRNEQPVLELWKDAQSRIITII